MECLTIRLYSQRQHVLEDRTGLLVIPVFDEGSQELVIGNNVRPDALVLHAFRYRHDVDGIAFVRLGREEHVVAGEGCVGFTAEPAVRRVRVWSTSRCCVSCRALRVEGYLCGGSMPTLRL